MKVADILKKKGPEVITTYEEKLVIDAVETLVRNGIGGLLGPEPGGEDRRHLHGARCAEAVRHGLPRARPDPRQGAHVQGPRRRIADDDVDHVEAIMTEKRIRHLPVISKKRLVGIISIGDLVKAQVTESKVEIRYLRDYIEGRYPG